MSNKKLNNRLKTVLNQDKKLNPHYIKDIIKSDIFYLLNNYFEVEFKDINIDIDVDNQNLYTISISAHGDRLKIMKTLV